MKKRILSLLLALCLAFSLAPAVHGEDGEETPDFYCRTYINDRLYNDEQPHLIGTAGMTMEVVFYTADSAGTPLTLTGVTFTPGDGTAQDAVVLNAAENGRWSASFLHTGMGTLTCTTGTAEYTMEVFSLFPPYAFYTAFSLEDAHLVLDEVTLSAGDSLWLICQSGLTKETAENISWSCETQKHSFLSAADYLETELVEYTPNSAESTVDEGPFYAVKVTLKKIYGTQMTLYARGGVSVRCTVLNQDPPQLTQLAEPSELHWSDETPGLMCFTANRPTQNRYDWELFRTDLDEPVMRVRHSFSAFSDDNYRTLHHFIWGNVPHERLDAADCDMESGTYYFTLRSLGDDQTYSDSETVTSPEWVYTKPETRLEQVTNLRWEGRTACWDAPAGTEGKKVTYSVEFYRRREYWSGSPDNITVYWDDIGGYTGQSETSALLTDRILSYGGTGLYAFRVQAISWDISEVYNSLWTDQSETISVTATGDQVNDQLEDLANQYTKEEPLTAEEKAELKATLADVGDALEQAMAADQGEKDGTVDKVAALENLVGGPAGVTVSDTMTDKFDQTKVSIVGANLNTEGTATATLQIGAPSGAAIPELYRSTVQFSMKLDGVDGTAQHQQLKVPVCITLPVPEGIDPDFLVILHARSDGSWDQIRPRIFSEEGVIYASFVVVRFSNFAMAVQTGAQLDGYQITVNAPAGAVYALAAVYDADGQLISTEMAAVPANGTATLAPSRLAEGASVKVFYLNTNYQPVSADTVLPLNAG